MEIVLADLINNPKVPKMIRYSIISVVSLFLLFVGVYCSVKSPMIMGNVFGIILCILTLTSTVYTLRKIHKN